MGPISRPGAGGYGVCPRHGAGRLYGRTRPRSLGVRPPRRSIQGTSGHLHLPRDGHRSLRAPLPAALCRRQRALSLPCLAARQHRSDRHSEQVPGFDPPARPIDVSHGGYTAAPGQGGHPVSPADRNQRGRPLLHQQFRGGDRGSSGGIRDDPGPRSERDPHDRGGSQYRRRHWTSGRMAIRMALHGARG